MERLNIFKKLRDKRMGIIEKNRIFDNVVKIIEKSVVDLPEDVENAIRRAEKVEKDERARILLNNILDNIEIARKNSTPICQDTGIPIFYVKIGSEVGTNTIKIITEIRDIIVTAVREATEKIPLRPNVVHPLTRENSGDNTGIGVPIIEFEFLDGMDYIEITAFPKGAGSENVSCFKMLDVLNGIEGVKEFVIDVVARSNGKPCPPVIVGVGIGGTSDKAMSIAKRALLRKVGSHNPRKEFADLENELYKKINELGIGPMGIGGNTTCLAVHIENANCHTASLPVAVNLQCWAARKATVRIYGDGEEFS